MSIKLNKRETILKAVTSVKNSQFKATALKVELEAHFSRLAQNRHGVETVDCLDCGGDYEGAEACDNCAEYGYVRIVDDRYQGCDLDHPDSEECESCYGSGRIDCTSCEEGSIELDSSERTDWSSSKYCHEWLMAKLSEFGLAEEQETAIYMNHDNYETNWHPKGALKYAQFYNDGSVDSEFTFTVSLANKENIFLVPKIVAIFKELGSEIGNGINVSRAGMHMAFINHPDCKYGDNYSTNTSSQKIRYHNFSRSMILLMPALFFLASSSEKSRQLGFRLPRVDSADDNYGDGKYSAVNYTKGALEFRTFETCYDRPDTVLDNFVVMANCLRYWTTKYKSPGLEKIVASTSFGNDNDDTLGRLYCTVEHISLLNTGLTKIKPAYMTIRECKMQRKFSTDIKSLRRQLKEISDQAKVDYQEYEERFNWYIQVRRKKYEAQYLTQQMDKNEGHFLEANILEAMKEVEKSVEEVIEDEKKLKKSLTVFVNDKIKQHNDTKKGNYRLAVS